MEKMEIYTSGTQLFQTMEVDVVLAKYTIYLSNLVIERQMLCSEASILPEETDELKGQLWSIL